MFLSLVLVAVLSAARPMPASALGTVTLLDAWPTTPQMTGTTGNLTGTFAVSNGTNINRLLVVLVCDYDSGGSSGQTFSATYGVKTLTQAFLQNNNSRQTWIGYLKETDIASRGGDAVTVTVTGTHTDVVAYIASYSGVNQTTPVTDDGGVYIDNLNNQPIGGPLNVNAGGYGIYGWSGQSPRTRTTDSETYTEHSDANNPGTFNYGVASKAFAATTTTNPSVTWSASNRVSVSFITLNPDSSYPPPNTTSISPTTKTVGDAAFTLTVNGTNFVNGVSVVRIDGADRATTFVSTGQLTATIPASDLTTAGGKSITVFTPAPGGGMSNAQTLAVKITPTITWVNPADIVYGTALSSTQLCATASVPGTFVYSPDLGALLPAGDSQTLHVDFTPTDTASYHNASADVTINVNRATLTVTANDRGKTYGDTVTFAGTEFSAVGLVSSDAVTSVTLASAGAVVDATVDGSPYAIVPSAATGTGLSNYNITYVNGSLTVNKASIGIALIASVGESTRGQSVTFTATPTDTGATGIVTFEDGGTTLGSSELSDGTATLTISSLSAGSHAITAVYSGDANFAGSTSSVVDLTVKAAAGLGWALIGGIIAGATLVGLFLLLVVFRRRREHPSGAHAIGRGIEVTVDDAGKNRGDADTVLSSPTSPASPAAGDALSSELALLAVENVGTYSIALERELERSLKKVQKNMESAIQAVSRTVETKDPYVALHQKRVSQLACTIAKEMGLTAWQIDGIRVAGMLHDIGKITVPTEILTKPGKLSPIEVSLIKDHPKVAFDILNPIEFDWPIARIVVQHHERLDGSGYPYGITGKDMLLEAKILGVADVVEAMSSNRPYRPALGVEEALAELARGDGTLYDSEVVRACEKVLNERGFKIELTSSPA